MDVEVDRFENGDVAVEVRSHAGLRSYVVEVGRFAYVLLSEKEWSELRELLQAFWEEPDGTNGAG